MSTTVAQLSADSKIAISLKKLQGKAHTKNDNELYNEGLPSGITMDSTTIFGVRPPENPSQDLNSITSDIVEKVRLVVEFIPGSDSVLGRHGFKLKLPSDYETVSTNPNKSTAPFVNNQVLVESNGALQLVPPQYHYLYEAKPYYGTEPNLTQIPLADPRDWNLDYFNGVMFQQDPYGPGNDAQNPTFVDAYIYIGDYLDTVVGEGSGGGGASSSATYLTLSNNAELDAERVFTTGTGLTGLDAGSNNTYTLEIDDSIVATVSGTIFTGKIEAPEIVSNQIKGQNLFLEDGISPTLVGGNNIVITTGTDGSRTISTTGGDSAFVIVNPGELNTTSSVAFAGNDGDTISADSNGSNVFFYVSGSAGDDQATSLFGGDIHVSGSLTSELGTNVGPVSYTDGYFTSLQSQTPVGEIISNMNDLFKKLTPASAPILSEIDESPVVGTSGKLSFGASNVVSGFTNYTLINPNSLPVDINGTFAANEVVDGIKRIGLVGINTPIVTGNLGSNVVSNIHSNSIVNYPAGAFGNANEGTLILELNGVELYSIDLTDSGIGANSPGAGTGLHTNVNSSGFSTISTVGYSTFISGDSTNQYPHRTGKWQVGRQDFRNGHNYVRIIFFQRIFLN